MFTFRMRSFLRACIIYRPAIRPPPPIFAAQRAEFSQSQQQFGHEVIFDASQLVLDLNAADCKYVRPYEEPDDVSGSTAEVKVGRAGSGYIRRGIRNIFRATGADYLYLAMAKRNSDGSTFLSPIAREVLRRNGVSKRYGSFRFTVQLLRDITALEREPIWAPIKYGPLPGENYYLRLLDCRTLEELRRTTHLMATTSEGCKFLSDNGSVIVDAIRSCRIHTDLPPATKIVSFINALSQRLGNHGIDLGEPLCDAGMYYAAKSLSLRALKKYLEAAVASDCSPFPSKHRKNALQIVTNRFGQFCSGTIVENTFPHNGRLKECILELLTGWDGGEVPGPETYRKPSFASLIRDNDDMYYRYITCLGCLGASDILWHEWMDPGLTPIPESLEQAGEGNNRTDVFIIAFLMADDFARALLVAESSKHMGPERAKAREFLLDQYGPHGVDKIFSDRFKGQLADLSKL